MRYPQGRDTLARDRTDGQAYLAVPPFRGMAHDVRPIRAQSCRSPGR